VERLALIVTGLSLADEKRIAHHINEHVKFENCVAGSKLDWDEINSRVAFMSMHVGSRELGEHIFGVRGSTRPHQPTLALT